MGVNLAMEQKYTLGLALQDHVQVLPFGFELYGSNGKANAYTHF